HSYVTGPTAAGRLAIDFLQLTAGFYGECGDGRLIADFADRIQEFLVRRQSEKGWIDRLGGQANMSQFAGVWIEFQSMNAFARLFGISADVKAHRLLRIYWRWDRHPEQLLHLGDDIRIAWIINQIDVFVRIAARIVIVQLSAEFAFVPFCVPPVFRADRSAHD